MAGDCSEPSKTSKWCKKISMPPPRNTTIITGTTLHPHASIKGRVTHADSNTHKQHAHAQPTPTDALLTKSSLNKHSRAPVCTDKQLGMLRSSIQPMANGLLT